MSDEPVKYGMTSDGKPVFPGYELLQVVNTGLRIASDPMEDRPAVVAAKHAIRELIRTATPTAPEIVARVNGACAEIARELGYRRSCYPKWVGQGRMKQEVADRQIAALEDAVVLLRELSGVKR